MVYVMRNGRRVIAALSFLLLCCGVHVHAQRVAVKTNALGWLTASPNVEAEFVLGSHVSLNMGIAANQSVQTTLKRLSRIFSLKFVTG